MEKMLQSIDLAHITTTLVEYLPKVLAAVVVLVLFFLAYRITRRALRATLGKAGFHPKLIELMVDNIYRYALMIVGLVMAADQLGVNVGAALAGLGVAGVAVGFAAQDSIANVISGIMIFWDKPFIVGDWITVEGEYGKVSDITLRTTRIRTPQNTWVVIPNKKIIDAVLDNHSKQGELRLDLEVGIAYKEHIPAAREVMLKAVSKIETVQAAPAPDVVVESLGNSSVNLLVRVWIESAEDERRTQFAVIEACKLALDEAGIQIPFPHLQLFVDEVKPPVWRDAARMLGAGAPEEPAGPGPEGRDSGLAS